ncbi:Arm DNA-binding domain-containing protein [Sphingomonas sp. Leaf257]|jgi:hypothetical protein|uniref:Arm DNA-binding domain-containing protein n=1 Tax=Sphingomonas sp. Leaf257 TaxID=1736309 RepID=UPI0006F45F8B|nr:Arm DNA-binding domain-containing protein [Sphingomonas sp. Leaf257]KQO51425.1 hypothetical protein ASF14_07965 [Sphingomonas sp. Leaf257]
MLTVAQIRALKPAARPSKVADTDGMYLLVQPSGALLWRLRYRCCGMKRKLSLGSFPDVSLVQARRKRDEAKAELDDGIDPVEETIQVQTPPRTLATSHTDAGEAPLPSKAAQIR